MNARAASVDRRMGINLRLRFSVRSLLVGVLILSIGLTYLSLFAANAREQANAVRRMQALGATIYYDFHHYYDDGPCVEGSRKPTDWTWARKLLGNDFFSTVHSVEFIGHRYWSQSPSRRFVSFGPAPIATAISRDADRYIHLLQELPKLQTLGLSYSSVSDRSVPLLGKLQDLKGLSLDNTMVTQEGVDRLRKSLPNCEITWRARDPNDRLPL